VPRKLCSSPQADGLYALVRFIDGRTGLEGRGCGRIKVTVTTRRSRDAPGLASIFRD
jgi:hypothetical protein